MDKILFIIPPYTSFDSFINPNFNEGVVVKKSRKHRKIIADIPLGVLTMDAYLKKHTDVETKLIDFNIVLNKMESFGYDSFSDLFHGFLSAKKQIGYMPDIIGISALFTTSYHNMLDAAGIARNIFPNALIIAGGGIPTNIYERIFKTSTCFDALCYGEGEKPLLGLVKAIDKKEFLRTHPSWITREKVECKQSYRHDFIEDLDEIPFLDYGILDINDYTQTSLKMTFPLEEENIKGIELMTSRGCSHKCCFCSSHSVHGRKMRYYSLNRVKEDFKRLRDQCGIKEIIFNDDNLIADRQRVFEILNIVKNLKLVAFFASSFTIYALDRKMLEAIKGVGIKQIVLAVESGSDRVLREIMHKPLSRSIVKRVLADCHQLGMASELLILMGLPGETKQDMENARSFFKTLNVTWFRISTATALPGSEMFDICMEKNYFKGDYINCDYKKAIIETEDFTAEYIEKYIYFLNLELNFVENSDFRSGKNKRALKGFENTIKVKDDHAFAYYYAAKCYKMMGLNEKYLAYKTKYQEIIKESAFWMNYARQFNLNAL